MTTPDLMAARQLEKSGMTRPEAEAVVGLVRTVAAPLATTAKLETVEKSTKDALATLGESLREEMKSMEELLRTEMKALESGMLWKVAGMNLTMVGLVIATMRFLPA